MIRIEEGFPKERLTKFPLEVTRRAEELPFLRNLYVTDMGHFPDARNHYVNRPEGSASHIVIYNTAGMGWCELGGKRFQVPPKYALVIPAGTPHAYGSEEDRPWSIYWAHFSGQNSEGLVASLEGSLNRSCMFVPREEIIVDAFEDAYRWIREGFSDAILIAIAAAFTRMASFLIMYQRASNVKALDTEERILKSIQWMRENLSVPVTLDRLAGQAAISPPHYSSIFKKQIGVSPIGFLIRLRMQEACRLLDHTNFTISEIAQTVGYEDSFHFSRMFKNVVGSSPRDYRKSVKG